MQISSKELIQSLKTLVLALVLAIAISAGTAYVRAWTGPTGTAPSNNTPAPINVGSSDQTKSGGINFQGYAHFTGYGTDSWFPYVNGANYLRGPLYFNSVLYDENNAGYYLDPNGTSRLNYVVADNTYTYGNADANDFYVRAVGRWASAPAVSMDCYDAVIRNCDYGSRQIGRYCRTCVNNSCSGYVQVDDNLSSGNCILEGAPI